MSFHDWRFHHLAAAGRSRGPPQLRLSCIDGGGGAGVTAPAIKEKFADEEDCINAGGREIVYVQMQGMKPMELQDKIEDKVQLFSFFLFPSSLGGT